MEKPAVLRQLAYVDRLVKAGIDENRAWALSDALEEALCESVATKNDIAELRHEIHLLSRDLTIRVGRCSWPSMA